MSPPPGRRRPRRHLPRHLYLVLGLIPDSEVWISNTELTTLTRSIYHEGIPLDENGQIAGIRDLRRHGFTVADSKSNPDDVRWTRTPKGSQALRLRKRPVASTTPRRHP